MNNTYTLRVGDKVVDTYDDLTEACRNYDVYDEECDITLVGRTKELVLPDGSALLHATIQPRPSKDYLLNFDDFGDMMCAESDSFILSMIDEGFFRDIEKEIRELCRRCVEHGIHLATERLDREFDK